jgi:hypothetical protein
MQTKVIPFGAKARGAVLESRPAYGVLIVAGDDGEAYALVGTGSKGMPGQRGTLEFREGGPVVGYWFFTPDQDEAVEL